MEPPRGIWIRAAGNGEFRVKEGRWIHAPDSGRWADLPVPGAQDVTLEDLHGHRIMTPGPEHGISAHDWRFKDRDRVIVRSRDAQSFVELSWARTSTWINSKLGTVYVVETEQWERRRSSIIGMWAPELLDGDIRGVLAAAGLDERAATTAAEMAAGYRRALMRRGNTQFTLSHRALARAASVSRGRVDQILGEAGDVGQTAAASAKTRDEILTQLSIAAESHRRATERLRSARNARTRAIRDARRQSLSYAQIALCLNVSRGRVQQLAKLL